MASGRLLRHLFKVANIGDSEAFRSVAQAIIDEERAKNHHLLANDLQKILRNGTPSFTGDNLSFNRNRPEPPTDRERDLPLADVRVPRQSLDSVVLSDFNLASITHLVHEQCKSELLRAHGLTPQTKLLFCGPPGCGKTLTAEALAYELQRELVIVRVDAVVSSFLGETASNLRRVFEFLASGPYVAIFDEFDALGRERSDPTEHGELKRVVNAFLQLLDSYSGQSVLIAATNHEGQLDYALWRRFDEVLRFDHPARDQIERAVKLKLRAIPHDVDTLDDQFLGALDGLSFAEIERTILHASKHAVLSGEKSISRSHLRQALDHELRRLDVIGRASHVK